MIIKAISLSLTLLFCLLTSSPIVAQEQEQTDALARKFYEFQERRAEIDERLEKLKGGESSDEQRELRQVRDRLDVVLGILKSDLEKVKRQVQEEKEPRAAARPKKVKSERGEIEIAKERLSHMKAAHKHLKEAGLDELAIQVAQRAEKLQAQLQREFRPRRATDSRQARNRRDDPFREDVGGAIRELNAEVLTLRQEIKEIRKMLDSRKE